MQQKNPTEITADLFDRIEKMGEVSGRSTSWIIRMATGNQHLHARLMKKAEVLTADIAKIELHLTKLENEEPT